ncbi:MAG: cupin domain-containing protein [Gammaproteobacteria bacterium]
MNRFPHFMTTKENAVASESQSSGVKGWVYDGVDGKQMAYWICETDGISEEHTHDFDEYFIVIEGEYILELGGASITLKKGDEYHIEAGIPHAGRFKAGTRTIHCFGGKRAVLA